MAARPILLIGFVAGMLTPAHAKDAPASLQAGSLEDLGRAAGVDIEPTRELLKNIQASLDPENNPRELFPLSEGPSKTLMRSGPGNFPVRRMGRVHFMEIREDQMERLFLCSPTLVQGTGEMGFHSSQFAGEFPGRFVWYFRLAGDTIQFIRKNTLFRADPGTPMDKAVRRSFSDSILATVPVASSDAVRNTYSIEMEPIFLKDILHIEPALRQAYAGESPWKVKLDEQASSVEEARAFPQNVEIRSHLLFTGFEEAHSQTLPDPRNISIVMHYSLSALPEEPSFRPRQADDRVGHFTVTHQDWSDPAKKHSIAPYTHNITRWHLEKADPKAPVSVVKNPIVFWLEDTLPHEFREPVKKGILAWNAAFEALGLKDAIQVKEQDKDLSEEERKRFDPASASYNVVRWFLGQDAGYAVGPFRVNPLTGQIYNAVVSLSAQWARIPTEDMELVKDSVAKKRPPPGRCDYGHRAMQQAAWAISVLNARGLMNPEEKKKFIDDIITHVMAHEIGHNLGLRHNFKASTIHPLDRINQDEGGVLTGSVMDYTPVNIAPKGTRQGAYWQTKLGPYDYWAIEYAYKILDAVPPEEEGRELKGIASRGSSEPGLAYGTDEDAFGIDPEANAYDLGRDPLAFSLSRLDLTRELWKNLETAPPDSLKDPDGYGALRRSFNIGMREYELAVTRPLKWIGGIITSRARPEDPGGKAPFEPVPASTQKEVLDFLGKHALSAKAFQFNPELLKRLGQSRQETLERPWPMAYPYPIEERVLGIQTAILDHIYDPEVMDRLVKSRSLAKKTEDALPLEDVFEWAEGSIWRELKSRSRSHRISIHPFGRTLQRKHLKYLEETMLDESAPSDANALARSDLNSISRNVKHALKEAKLDSATRKHLEDMRALVEEILAGDIFRRINRRSS